MEGKKIELKPCPFCGGKAIFETFSLNNTSFSVGFKYEIRCEECKAGLPKIYETNLSLTDDGIIDVLKDGREAAASDWNRRTDNENIKEEN